MMVSDISFSDGLAAADSWDKVLIKPLNLPSAPVKKPQPQKAN